MGRTCGDDRYSAIFAKAKKVKSLTLHTHGFPLGLVDGTALSSYTHTQLLLFHGRCQLKATGGVWRVLWWWATTTPHGILQQLVENVVERLWNVGKGHCHVTSHMDVWWHSIFLFAHRPTTAIHHNTNTTSLTKKDIPNKQKPINTRLTHNNIASDDVTMTIYSIRLTNYLNTNARQGLHKIYCGLMKLCTKVVLIFEMLKVWVLTPLFCFI